MRTQNNIFGIGSVMYEPTEFSFGPQRTGARTVFNIGPQTGKHDVYMDVNAWQESARARLLTVEVGQRIVFAGTLSYRENKDKHYIRSSINSLHIATTDVADLYALAMLTGYVHHAARVFELGDGQALARFSLGTEVYKSDKMLWHDVRCYDSIEVVRQIEREIADRSYATVIGTPAFRKVRKPDDPEDEGVYRPCILASTIVGTGPVQRMDGEYMTGISTAARIHQQAQAAGEQAAIAQEG